MPQVHQQRVSFNTGLVSPTISTRLDLEKAAAGCRVLDNMLPRTSGGVFKRAGTRFLNYTKANQQAYLLPFNYSLNTRLQFELGDNYIRFWRDRERITKEVGNMSTWSGTNTQYSIGSGVWQSSVLYRANTTHTPSGGNQPPSSSWDTTNIKAWHVSTSYVVGDIAFAASDSPQSNIYICKTNHTSHTTSFETDYLAGKWAIITADQYWFSGVAYAVGYKVRMLISGFYRIFRCKTAHTSTAASKPGSGASWSTYWEEVSTIPDHNTSSKVYKAGDMVKVSSTLYVANADHTSSGSNEPTDPGSPWTAVTYFTPWTGTSTARAIGDWVWYGGQLYRFTSALTTTSYLPSANVAENALYAYGLWTASPTYAVDDIVCASDSTLYVCFKAHSTASTTEPGTTGGSPYWQKLANVFKWVTGTNYLAGQYVVGGLKVYKVLNYYQSGASIAADVGTGDIKEAPYPLELPTEYSVSEVADVRTVQVNDQTWLLHPDHEILLLERFSNTAWRLGSIEWDMPPLRDENVEDNFTMNVAATTGDTTITASGAFFDPGMVGGYMMLAHQRSSSTDKLVLSANGTSAGLRVLGKMDVFIYGTTWKGTVTLETSNDGSTNWLPHRTWEQTVANMRTISTSVTFDQETYARLVFVKNGTGGTSDYALLEAANSRVQGLVKLTGYVNQTNMSCTVIRDVWSTGTTTLWAEGAYSDYRGWPRSGTIHEQRLVLIGSGDEGEKVRMSRLDNFFDFSELTADDGAITFQIASRESNALLWVESFGSVMAIGSQAEEWVVSAGTEGKVITPSNPPRIERQTRRGSCTLQAVLMGDALVFVGNDRQHVQEFSYSFTDNRHVAQDITQLAEYLFGSGVKRIASARHPEETLYCVMNNGALMVMTYDRVQNVVAWSRYTTGAGNSDTFEDVSVIYGGDLNADEVWFVIKRDNLYCVEALDKPTSRYMFDGDEQELVYVDSATVVAGPLTTVGGLDRMDDRTVKGIADGVVFEKTVEGGEITFDAPVGKVVVGLPFTAKLQGSWLDLQLQDGSSMDRKQRSAKASVFLFQSSGLDYHANPGDASLSWVVGEVGNVVDIASRAGINDPERFPLTTGARHEDQNALTLRSDYPLPLNVLAVVYANEYFG